MAVKILHNALVCLQQMLQIANSLLPIAYHFLCGSKKCMTNEE
jgi:hypothetical protein